MPVMLGKLVYLCTLDPDNGPWTVLSELNVPHQLKTPEKLTRMMNGECAKAHDEGLVYYRVQGFEETVRQIEEQQRAAPAL